MGPVNWLAVVLAAMLAVAIGIVWHGPLFRSGRQMLEGPDSTRKRGAFALPLLVFLLAAAMIGHNFARIGDDGLAARPWLYFMMTGGLALFLVAPALFLALIRRGVPPREIAIEAGFWIVAYLAMGAAFWALS